MEEMEEQESLQMEEEVFVVSKEAARVLKILYNQ